MPRKQVNKDQKSTPDPRHLSDSEKAAAFELLSMPKSSAKKVIVTVLELQDEGPDLNHPDVIARMEGATSEEKRAVLEAALEVGAAQERVGLCMELTPGVWLQGLDKKLGVTRNKK